VKASHLFAAADNFNLAAIPRLDITSFLRKFALEILIACAGNLSL